MPGERRELVRNRLIESRLTPNAISLTGFALNVVAAVLVWEQLFFLGGVAFIVGSIMDTLDGRYSRMSGKGTPFGAFLDSTLDRIEEGIVLTAVAGYFALHGNRVAAAAVVVAVLASLMVSYTRARAEALGVECKVGIATRPVRVVILAIGLVFARGASLGRLRAAAAGRVRAGGAQPRSPSRSASGTSARELTRGVTSRARRSSYREPWSGPRLCPRGAYSSINGPSPSEGSTVTMSSNGNGAASKNGAARYQSEKVRVAIIGVGNCASAFVQGVHYYRDANPDERVPGLMHVDLGGYHVRDIEFTAAFDIDSTKVGKDLGQAIWAGQNNTIKFAKVPSRSSACPSTAA